MAGGRWQRGGRTEHRKRRARQCEHDAGTVQRGAVRSHGASHRARPRSRALAPPRRASQGRNRLPEAPHTLCSAMQARPLACAAEMPATAPPLGLAAPCRPRAKKGNTCQPTRQGSAGRLELASSALHERHIASYTACRACSRCITPSKPPRRHAATPRRAHLAASTSYPLPGS